MKNKKFLIICIIIIIIIAIVVGINMTKAKVGEVLFNKDGTVVNGHEDLINHLRNIEDETERRKQIDFSVQKNIITQNEANELY